MDLFDLGRDINNVNNIHTSNIKLSTKPLHKCLIKILPQKFFHKNSSTKTLHTKKNLHNFSKKQQQAMDLFDIGRDINNNNNNSASNTNSKKVTIIDNDDSAIVRAMEEIQMPVLVIGVQSDLLFPCTPAKYTYTYIHINIHTHEKNCVHKKILHK